MNTLHEVFKYRDNLKELLENEFTQLDLKQKLEMEFARVNRILERIEKVVA